MQTLLKKLAGLNPSAVLGISLGCVMVMGVLDYVTGHEYSFSIFYVFPVALAAWFINVKAGMLLSLLSAIVWDISNRFAGEQFSHPAIAYWNAATRFGFFMIITTLLVRLRQVLEHERALSRTDYLSGALNSRAFYALLDAEIERQRRHRHPFSLAYLDLDNFKSINDRYGHTTGDELLKIVARTIAENLRAIDAVARLGGDEFAILLLETPADVAQLAMERIQTLLLATMRQQQWPVTFSIGIVSCPVPPPSVDALIQLADDRMYLVKRNGKNNISLSTYTG
ncbi:MAG: GGDEF domain-containing protein [Candidatus Competibacteraceae bacterium]